MVIHIRNMLGFMRNMVCFAPSLLFARKTSLTANTLRLGSVVRIGPNRYSFTLPHAVKKIYELGGKFEKSRYYLPLLSPDPDTQHIFPMMDNERHKDRRRKISALYTMSTMVSYENAVDKLNEVCMRKMHQFAEERCLIDIPHWMQYYAFDVIGEITVRHTMLFLGNGGQY